MTGAANGTDAQLLPINDAARRNQGVRPLPLRTTTRALAANSGQKGAIIITVGDGGINVGTDGLTPEEVREALCTAIHASYLFADDR